MAFVAATKARSSVGNLANTRAVAESNLYCREKEGEGEREGEREKERERERINNLQHVILQYAGNIL